MTPRCLLCLLAALLEATASSSTFSPVAPPAPREVGSDAPSARGLNLTPVFPMLDSTLGVLSYLAFGVYIVMLFIDLLGKKDPLRSAALLLKRQVQPLGLCAALSSAAASPSLCPPVYPFVSLSPTSCLSVCLPVSLISCLCLSYHSTYCSSD